MVARFAPPKLHAELLDVLSGLTDVAWSLRLVGDGPQLEDCRDALAGQPQLADRVELLGHRDDVADVLAAADVGVLWSRYEGLPMSVIEYMRAGLCCVGSDLPGVRELLGSPAAGVVARGPTELGMMLRRLLEHTDEVAALGELARRRFERHYSAAAMLAGVAAVYDAVLAASSSDARTT